MGNSFEAHMMAVYGKEVEGGWNKLPLLRHCPSNLGNCHGLTFLGRDDVDLAIDEDVLYKYMVDKIISEPVFRQSPVPPNSYRIVVYSKQGEVRHSARRCGERWVHRWAGVDRVVAIEKPDSTIFNGLDKVYYNLIANEMTSMKADGVN